MRFSQLAFSAAMGVGGLTVCGPAQSDARQVVSDQTSRRELHLTAYRTGGQDTAFLREVREVDLPAGEVRIAMWGVPDTVERQTVAVRVVEGPPVEVLEQTFSYDLMTPASLLRAAEGTNITIDVVGIHDGNLRPVGARVLTSGVGGTVVRTREGYTSGLDGERLQFPRVPKRLSAWPTLTWHALSVAAGKRKIEISYLLKGLRWEADYVATLSRDGRKMDLSGWVTIRNQTAVVCEGAAVHSARSPCWTTTSTRWDVSPTYATRNRSRSP